MIHGEPSVNVVCTSKFIESPFWRVGAVVVTLVY